MWDSNLLFSNAQVVTADAFSTLALDLGGGTPEKGLWAGVYVSAWSGGTNLKVTCYTKDTDAAWATTDDVAGQLPALITATGFYVFKIHSKKRFVKVHYDETGGINATVTAGIISGPNFYHTA